MEADTYQHVPLKNIHKNIRLLKASEDDDELSFSVSQGSIDEATEYLAISYTWGDPTDLCSIRLDGQALTVRKNTLYALQQVTRQYPGYNIWIDAICINQRDIAEKSAQVNMMGIIYEKASQVVCCIGPADESSEYLHAWITTVPEELPHLLHADMYMDRPSDAFKDEFRRLTREQSNEGMAWLRSRVGPDERDILQLFKHYSTFRDRAYWSRLWILQEVFAGNMGRSAPQILCGDHCWQWAALRLFDEIMGWTIWKIKSLRGSDLDKEWALGSTAYPFVLATTPTKKSISNAIAWFPYFHCYDPRDHIFGLLRTIMWRENLQPVQADYSKTTCQLLIDLLVHFADDGNIWSWEDFKRLFDGLKVTAQDEHVVALMNRQQHRPHVEMPRILLDAYGSSANRLYPASGDKLETDLLSSSSDQDQQNQAFAAFADEVTNHFKNSTRKVYTDGSVSAIVPARAREGDFLAQLHDQSAITYVLRLAQDSHCELVGWALLSHAYVRVTTGRRVVEASGWNHVNLVLGLTVEQVLCIATTAFNDLEMGEMVEHLFGAGLQGLVRIEELVHETRTPGGVQVETKPFELFPSS